MKKLTSYTLFLLFVISVYARNSYDEILDRYEAEVVNYSIIYNKSASGNMTRAQAEKEVCSLYDRLTVIQGELTTALRNMSLSQKTRLKNIAAYMEMAGKFNNTNENQKVEKLIKEYELALYDIIEFLDKAGTNMNLSENTIRRQLTQKANKIERLSASLEAKEDYMSEYQYARWEMLKEQEEEIATTLIASWYAAY